jgi:hypothetical protein
LSEYLDGRAWDEPIQFFEWTSGSSSPRKKIPYTQSLRHSFEAMFEVWLLDLLTHLPELKSGQCYFSISPVSFETESEIKSDFDYTSGMIKLILASFSVVPQRVKALRDPQSFREVTALYLLASPELEIVSVWSPSFFLSLLDYIRLNRVALMAKLNDGVVNTQAGTFNLPPSCRAQAVQLSKADFDWSQLWPNLKFISCWGHGSSAMGYAELKKRFPRLLFQAKGLLATEAPLTIPFLQRELHLPLLKEVFYELMTDQGLVIPLSHGKNGEEYELVISQKSGFLRYRIGDRIRLKRQEKYIGLEFVCRSRVSDLVGEKLHEAFVVEAVAKARVSHGIFTLVPSVAANRYFLVSAAPLSPLASACLEQELRANPHYDLARNFDQLLAVQCFSKPDLLILYEEFYRSKGLKLGDIKWNCLFHPASEGDSFIRFIESHAMKEQGITPAVCLSPRK